MDTFLLTKTLNYHGQELLRAIEGEQGVEQLRCVDLRSLDYHEYHKRAKEFGFKERQRRHKLFRFIGKKAHQLYTPPDLTHVIPVTLDADNRDLCCVMPPLENFMSVPRAERRRHFLESLRKYDMVIGQIMKKHDGVKCVQLLCMDGGKKREIWDLGIKVACKRVRVGSEETNVNPEEGCQFNEYVRAKVMVVTPQWEKIIVSLRSEFKDIRMGVITEEEIPIHHKNLVRYRSKTYEQALEGALGFSNPATVSHMSKLVGLPPKNLMSLMMVRHRVKYPNEEYAVQLRKVQSLKWANRSVRDGVAYFKEGNPSEACQCFNKALQIHPENVEALMARGALFANSNKFERALQDFERTLEIDPNHVNGKKYLSETLVALGRYHEEKGDIEEAAKSFHRAIRSDPDNANAKDALQAMEFREQKRLMAAAREQQILAQAPPRTLEPSVAYPYDPRQNILLKEEKQVSDHRRRPKRAWASPEKVETPVVHQKHFRDTLEADQKEPQGYWPHQQQCYWPPQSQNMQNITNIQGYWPQQQQNIEKITEPQVYLPPQQQNIQEVTESQSYVPPQQQTVEEKKEPVVQEEIIIDSSSSSSASPPPTPPSSKQTATSPKVPVLVSSQQRAPSPKVAFAMRKDVDLHYSKFYAHSAFLEEDDDDDDQPTSVKDSGEAGSHRSKNSSEEVVASRRPRRHYQSSAADERRDRRRPPGRWRDDSPPPSHSGVRNDSKRSDRRSPSINHEKTDLAVTRAPDIEFLKRSKQNFERRYNNYGSQSGDSLSVAKSAAFRINETLIRNATGLATKGVTLTPIKVQESSEDKSLAAMESYLENLRAQKKAELLAKIRDKNKKP